MISNQVIQNSIDELRAITKVDLGVFDVEGPESCDNSRRD